MADAPAIETSGWPRRTEVGRERWLDLRVERGEVFGFLGPNGAGKSTSIRLLLGLIHPTAGRAELLGFDVRRASVKSRRRVGYLPGDRLADRLTGKQQLDSLARLRGVDTPLRDTLCERFGAVLDRPIRELSKGNRQKLGLVQAFMHRPELLVLDEPTGGLDPLLQEEFRTLLRETAAGGRTVFLSSHSLDEVQHAADRVAIVRDGQLLDVDRVAGEHDRHVAKRRARGAPRRGRGGVRRDRGRAASRAGADSCAPLGARERDGRGRQGGSTVARHRPRLVARRSRGDLPGALP